MTDHRSYDYDVFDPNTTRWPEAGDKLFSPGWDTFLTSDAGERSYRLLRGYKEAGDLLIQKALADRSVCDNLVFPAFFLYRHYIELALKAIIDDHGAFAEELRGFRSEAVAKPFLRTCAKLLSDYFLRSVSVSGGSGFHFRRQRARAIGVLRRISQEEIHLSAKRAQRFGRYFATGPEFWAELQKRGCGARIELGSAQDRANGPRGSGGHSGLALHTSRRLNSVIGGL